VVVMDTMTRHDNELLTTFCRNFKQLCLERAVARTHNICFKKVGHGHFAGAESQIGSSVQRRKFSAKSPHLLKKKNR
jgi:hypothetical protein